MAAKTETTAGSYPEHDKLREIATESQACGEFLDWLLGPQRYVIGEYHRHGEACVEESCDLSTEFLRPAATNTRKLLAKFFKIDEDKLELEKRAMVKALSLRGRAP